MEKAMNPGDKQKRKLAPGLKGLLAVLLCAGAATVLADDTEIYFTNDASTESTANVLLVLDYSGSMKLTADGESLEDPEASPDSRMNIMRRVVEQVVNGAPSTLAMGVMNYGGHKLPATANGIKYPVGVLTPDKRQGVLDTVAGFKPEGYTPIVQSLYEASLYFRGENADYGNDPNPVIAANPASLASGQDPSGTTPVEHEVTCLLGDAACTEQGFESGDAACVAHPATPAQSIEIQDCVREDEAGQCLEFGPKETVELPARGAYEECTYTVTEQQPTFNRVYQSPITSECQANYVVLLSDGQPDDGIRPGSDQAIKTNIASEYGINCGQLTGDNADGTCGPELTAYLADTDLIETLPDTQTLKTYTIGFANSEGGNDYLKSLANLGEGSEGQQAFFTAADEDKLLQAFNDIIEDIAGNVSLLSPPVFSQDTSGFSTGDAAYLPLFRPSQLPDWRGNLKKYTFKDGQLEGANGVPAFTATGEFSNQVRSFWSTEVDGASVAKGGAASLLGTQRKLFTDTGDQLVAFSPAVFTNETLELDEGDATVSAAELLTFAKGLEPEGGLARKKMGDFLHSRPVLVDYDNRQVLFAGSNDGFLYAIDAGSGEELFAYMPRLLLPNLKTLYANDASEPHPYGVDGELSVFRSENGRILLYFGLRRGGRDYYALDITDPDAPLMQWHIEGGKGDFSELGQSWSKPIVTRLEEEKGADSVEVVMFAGGYDPAQDGQCSEDIPLQKCPIDKLETDPATRQADTQGRAIYAVDAHSGNLLWSIGKGGATYALAEMSNGLAANLSVLDIDSNGIADRIYAADVGGRIFRVDLPDGENRLLLEQDKVDKPQATLFADLNEGGVGNRRFYQEPDIAIVRDGLKRVITVAIGSGYRAHPLLKGDKTVQDRLYVLKDFDVRGLPDTDGLPRENKDLVDATDVDPGNALYGWYIDLAKAAGEKALARAVTLQGKVFFTTFSPATPPSNSCTAPLHSGAAYMVDINNGGKVIKPGEIQADEPWQPAEKITFSTADLPSEVYQTFSTNSEGEVEVTTYLGPGQGSSAVDTTVFDAVKRVYWEELH